MQATRYLGTTNPTLNDPSLKGELTSSHYRAAMPADHAAGFHRHLTRAAPDVDLHDPAYDTSRPARVDAPPQPLRGAARLMTEPTTRPGTAPRPAATATARRAAARSGGGRPGGWPAVAAVALGSFALVLSELFPVGALDRIAAGTGVSTGTGGLLMTAPGLAAAVTAPLLTLAARRTDRRLVLWTLSALTVGANLLCATAESLLPMLLGRLLLGFALGGFWAVGIGAVPRLVPPAAVHRASALVTAGISVGTVVSPPLASLTGQAAGDGWRTGFWITGALSLAALAAQLLLLPALPAGEGAGRRELLGAVRDRAVRAGLLATTLVFLGHFAAYTYITPYLERHARLGTGWVTGLLLGYGLAAIAGNFLAGLTLARSVRGTAGCAAAAVAVATGLLPLCDGSPALVAVLVVLWGVAFGAVPLSLQSWLAGAAPGPPEGRLAAYVTVVQLSLAGGALLGGLIVNGRGPVAAFAAATGLAALAALSTLRGRAGGGGTEQETVV
ncbi:MULTISPECIES: MFS transporter [Kitasatospora]|nr:MFS transporter [Kitasatospora setae]